jgi:hypothetical protein
MVQIIGLMMGTYIFTRMAEVLNSPTGPGMGGGCNQVLRVRDDGPSGARFAWTSCDWQHFTHQPVEQPKQSGPRPSFFR